MPENYHKKLDQIVMRIEYSGDGFKLPYEYFSYRNNFDSACKVGWKWLEAVEKSDPISAPVEAIAKSCEIAVAKHPAIATELLPSIVSSVRSSPKAFSSEKSPFLFVVVRFLKQPAFVALLSREMENDSSAFSQTLLPTLVAERLVEQKDPSKGSKLYAIFASSRPEGSEVWKSIAASEIQKKTAENQLFSAEELLKKEYPLHANWNIAIASLWLPWIAKARQSSGDLQMEAKQATDKLLENEKLLDRPKEAAVAIESGLEFGLYEKTWRLLQKIPVRSALGQYCSEQSLHRLLAAIERRELDILGTAYHGELNTIAEIAIRLRGMPSIDQIPDMKGKSLLAKDLHWLRQHAAKADRMARVGKKDKADRVVINWVSYLRKTNRELAERRWIHPKLKRIAEVSTGTFCKDAQEKLPSLRPAEEISQADWAVLVDSLHGKLKDCERQWLAGDAHSSGAGVTR